MSQKVPLCIHAADVGWLAGYLEGEGYFQADGTVIDVSSTDKDVVERLAKMFGESVVTYDKQSYYQNQDTSKWKRLYRTHVYGRKARTVMKMILPWMGNRRRERIEECLSYYYDDKPAKNEPQAQAASGITG